MPTPPSLVSSSSAVKMDYTENLPDEIICHIFSFLPQKDLYANARIVCDRWYRLSQIPSLWTTIRAGNDIPSRMLYKWLSQTLHLKNLFVDDRNDSNIIIQIIGIFCPELETLNIEISCCGAHRCACQKDLLGSFFLCHMLTNCRKLKYIFVDGVRVGSTRFFKLLHDRVFDESYETCVYVGPTNTRQLMALGGQSFY